MTDRREGSRGIDHLIGPDALANTRREAQLLAAARKPYADHIMWQSEEIARLTELLAKKDDRIDELLNNEDCDAIHRRDLKRIGELEEIIVAQEKALRLVRCRHTAELDIRGDIGCQE